jgi:hypothetical protein
MFLSSSSISRHDGSDGITANIVGDTKDRFLEAAYNFLTSIKFGSNDEDQAEMATSTKRPLLLYHSAKYEENKATYNKRRKRPLIYASKQVNLCIITI